MTLTTIVRTGLFLAAAMALAPVPLVLHAEGEGGIEVIGIAGSGDARAAAADVADGSAADAATDEAGADGEDALDRAMATAEAYLVTVAIRYQKDQGEVPVERYSYVQEEAVESLIENKKSSEQVGVMIDPAEGLVVSRDLAFQRRFIEDVVGHEASGKTFSLKPHGFYLDQHLAMFRAEGWPGQATAAPNWSDAEAEPFGSVYLATLGRERTAWHVSLTPASFAPVARGAEGSGLADTITAIDAGLVLDPEGQPLGVSAGTRISLHTAHYPWRGGDLAAGRRITFDEFDELRETVEARVGDFAHEVKIVYRQPEGDEENLEFDSEDPTSLIQYYYGYAISPTRILVPEKMEKIHIQRFKDITVRFNGRESPARFVGAYLHFGGFVIEVDGAESPGVLAYDNAGDGLDVGRALLTYRHERKFGKRRNIVWYTRMTKFDTDYKDRLWPTVLAPLERGTLVMDFDGRAIGLAITERRLEQERKGRDRQWHYYYGVDDAGVKLHLLSELAAALQDPEAHFDPNLKPATEQEEKRIVWLGVETQEMEPKLAEMLDRVGGSDQVQRWTRKGEIGLRVTRVYKGSPAAAIGLREGDILLSVTEQGREQPIELDPSSGGYGSWGRRWGRYGGGPTGSIGERRNYLTELLTRLGPGTAITLTYLSGSEKRSEELTLQWAPYDFTSADKYKDEATGVTVKDLTYDVRAVLQLPDDQPGVIVAKVEDGEKADIAQMHQYQIITEINGQAIRGVDAYRREMTALQQGEDGGTAVLTLLWLGKSRIVKIEFP